MANIIWATLRENLSLGCPTKRVSNQSPQLQRLAKKLKLTCSKFTHDTFQRVNNKGADQTARMRRVVLAFLVCNPRKPGFLASRPMCKGRNGVLLNSINFILTGMKLRSIWLSLPFNNTSCLPNKQLFYYMIKILYVFSAIWDHWCYSLIVRNYLTFWHHFLKAMQYYTIID